MKNTLTLTLDTEIIERAKEMAQRKGVSVSKLFEDAFSLFQRNPAYMEPDMAAQKFLSIMDEVEAIMPLNDNELLADYLRAKFD
jgi:hypothetical protein